jgi:hypothetical protein
MRMGNSNSAISNVKGAMFNVKSAVSAKVQFPPWIILGRTVGQDGLPELSHLPKP